MASRNVLTELAAVMKNRSSHIYCVMCGTSLVGKNHFPVNLSEDQESTDSILYFCSLCYLENDLVMKHAESQVAYISRVITCLAGARKSKPSSPDTN